MSEQPKLNGGRKDPNLELTDLIRKNIARISGVIDSRIEQLVQQARTHKERYTEIIK